MKEGDPKPPPQKPEPSLASWLSSNVGVTKEEHVQAIVDFANQQGVETPDDFAMCEDDEFAELESSLPKITFRKFKRAVDTLFD